MDYRRDHLNYHLTSHEVLRIYICAHDGCGESFKEKNELTIHQKQLHHFGMEYGQLDRNGTVYMDTQNQMRTENNKFLNIKSIPRSLLDAIPSPSHFRRSYSNRLPTPKDTNSNKPSRHPKDFCVKQETIAELANAQMASLPSPQQNQQHVLHPNPFQQQQQQQQREYGQLQQFALPYPLMHQPFGQMMFYPELQQLFPQMQSPNPDEHLLQQQIPFQMMQQQQFNGMLQMQALHHPSFIQQCQQQPQQQQQQQYPMMVPHQKFVPESIPFLSTNSLTTGSISSTAIKNSNNAGRSPWKFADASFSGMPSVMCNSNVASNLPHPPNILPQQPMPTPLSALAHGYGQQYSQPMSFLMAQNHSTFLPQPCLFMHPEHINDLNHQQKRQEQIAIGLNQIDCNPHQNGQNSTLSNKPSYIMRETSNAIRSDQTSSCSQIKLTEASKSSSKKARITYRAVNKGRSRKSSKQDHAYRAGIYANCFKNGNNDATGEKCSNVNSSRGLKDRKFGRSLVHRNEENRKGTVKGVKDEYKEETAQQSENCQGASLPHQCIHKEQPVSSNIRSGDAVRKTSIASCVPCGQPHSCNTNTSYSTQSKSSATAAVCVSPSAKHTLSTKAGSKASQSELLENSSQLSSRMNLALLREILATPSSCKSRPPLQSLLTMSPYPGQQLASMSPYSMIYQHQGGLFPRAPQPTLLSPIHQPLPPFVPTTALVAQQTATSNSHEQ